MSSKFDRFETFGCIADETTRKKLAESIFLQLQKKTDRSMGLPDVDTENYASAVEKILSNVNMRELCSKDPELAEKITQEILDFINSSKKQISKIENPFVEEHKAKDEFYQSKKEDFINRWPKINQILKRNYDKTLIDISYYDKEFNRSFSEKKKGEQRLSNFESIKEHFNDKWEQLLFKKQTKWELNQIEKNRKKYCEDLYKRIDELKKLQEALEPFTKQLGRLWDMSKGNWQKANLDIIKRYGELLQRDASLKELAEMLGRIGQAEKQFEEELFASIQLKPEWKVEHASKADLFGIHESDDISSLLASETALLADETTQSLFFKKFVEKKLQTFEYQAKMLSYKAEEIQNARTNEKKEVKGPFIICVDTSGSMHGTPETVAKTLCFAILKIAVRDNRKCYLISFSTGIETLNLTDLKASLDKLISFLSMSFLGGTDATPAMKEALRMLTTQDYIKADVIMVSDFVMSALEQATQEEIKSAKKNKTKFHSLVVGNSQNPAIIKDFDSNWYYDLNNPNSVLTLIKSITQL